MALLLVPILGCSFPAFAQLSGETSVTPRINVRNYGAVDDAQVAPSLTCNLVTTTLTCGSALFTPADVGKSIQIPYAGLPSTAPAPTQTLATQITAMNGSIDPPTQKFFAVTVATSGSASLVEVTWGTDNAPLFQAAANACPSPSNGTGALSAFTSKGCVLLVPNGGASGTGDYMFNTGITLAAQTSFEMIGMGNASKWEGSSQAGVRFLTAMPITILTVGIAAPTPPAGTNSGGFHLENITFRDTSDNGSALGGLLMYNMSEAVIAYCSFENFFGETADPANNSFPNILAYGMKANPLKGDNNNIVLLHDKGRNNMVWYDSSLYPQDGPIVIGGDVFPITLAPPGSAFAYTGLCYGIIAAGPIRVYGTHFDVGANNNTAGLPACYGIQFLGGGIVSAKFESSPGTGNGVLLEGGSTTPLTINMNNLVRSANGLYVTATTTGGAPSLGQLVTITPTPTFDTSFPGTFIVTSSGTNTFTYDQIGTPTTMNGHTVTATGRVAASVKVDGIFNNMVNEVMIQTGAMNSVILDMSSSLTGGGTHVTDNGTNDSWQVLDQQTLTSTTTFNGSLIIPVSAGAIPTANGSIAYDSTSNSYKVGVKVSGTPTTETLAATGSSACPAGQFETQDTPTGPVCASSNSSILTFFCTLAFASSGTVGLVPGSQNVNCNATSALITEVPVPVAGTVKNLYAVTRTVASTLNDGVVTVYHNGSAVTAFTCTIGNPLSSKSCNDTTHSFTVAAGDTISIRVSTPDISLSDMRASIQIQ